ncbi:RNA polymerase sigma factor [Sphingobacterium kyonggiense]|uniref:RNA polymerase sigma factor n=1 Tax=Sphingobacterium kyonggiense TaxID=714075 RepID=A0ABP7YBL1_9SPHI
MDSIQPEEMQLKNSKSFSDTVKKYSSQLMSFVKARVRKTADAEDILQEVWFQFSRLTNMDQLENAGAWLYAVTRNKITDSYRKKKTDSLDELTENMEEETAVLEKFLIADYSNSPEAKLFKDIFWDELYKALDELPEKQRSVFLLNEIDQLTLQQIADLQQENLKTIISRKGYAVKHLRLRLQGLYDELKH